MVFGTIVSSPRSALSQQKILHLSKVYLENARKETDSEIILVLCHDTEVSLSQLKKAAKHTEDLILREGIATVYVDLGKVLDSHDHRVEAQAFYKKSEKWR